MEKVLDVLKKQKVTFHDKNIKELDPVEVVEDYVKNCSECKEVDAIKELVPNTNQGTLLMIPEDCLQCVIDFGDLKHQGYGETYRRLKSWCTFPEFETQVNKKT